MIIYKPDIYWAFSLLGESVKSCYSEVLFWLPSHILQYFKLIKLFQIQQAPPFKYLTNNERSKYGLRFGF